MAYSIRTSRESGLLLKMKFLHQQMSVLQFIINFRPLIHPFVVIFQTMKIKTTKMLKGLLQEQDFVLVAWNNVLFPGQVMTIRDSGATVECVSQTKAWAWPSEKDDLF